MPDLSCNPLLSPVLLFTASVAAAALAWLTFRGAQRALCLVLCGILLAVGLGPTAPGVPAQRPVGLILVDTSRSMANEHRLDQVRELLRPFAEENDVQWHVARFDEVVRAGRFKDVPSWEPDGESTRIGSALRWACETYGELIACVLFTDGRTLGTEDPLAWALRLKERGTGLFPVLCGSAEEAPDAALIVPKLTRCRLPEGGTLRLPFSVVVASCRTGHAVVKASRLRGDPFEGKNREILTRRRVPLRHGRGHGVLSLPGAATPFSLWRIEVEVLPGELRRENNVAFVVTSPMGPRPVYLLLEGVPRWEGTFLLLESSRGGFSVHAVRQIGATRPAFVNLTQARLPLPAPVLRTGACVVLGERWETLVDEAGKQILSGKPVLLLPGARPPGRRALPWGRHLRGTLRVTPQGQRYASLSNLAGSKVAVREVHARGAVVLAEVVTEHGAAIPAVCYDPSGPLLFWGLLNMPWIAHSPMRPLSRLIEQAFGIAPRAARGSEKLMYDRTDLIRISGPAGTTVLVEVQGSARKIRLDSQGRATTPPLGVGIHRLRFEDGGESFFSVIDSRPETLLTAPDQNLLWSIARASGGRVFEPTVQSVREILAHSRKLASFQSPPSGAYVWDNPFVFVLYLATALALWLIRTGKAKLS